MARVNKFLLPVNLPAGATALRSQAVIRPPAGAKEMLVGYYIILFLLAAYMNEELAYYIGSTASQFCGIEISTQQAVRVRPIQEHKQYKLLSK